VAVDPARAKAIALGLPGASAAPHFHRLALRTPRKIFATLDEAACDLKTVDEPTLTSALIAARHRAAPKPTGR
jgi:hypothetical protein